MLNTHRNLLIPNMPLVLLRDQPLVLLGDQPLTTDAWTDIHTHWHLCFIYIDIQYAVIPGLGTVSRCKVAFQAILNNSLPVDDRHKSRMPTSAKRISTHATELWDVVIAVLVYIYIYKNAAWRTHARNLHIKSWMLSDYLVDEPSMSIAAALLPLFYYVIH